jgi:hypothetical protein
MKYPVAVPVFIMIFMIEPAPSQIVEHDSVFFDLDSVYYKYRIVEGDTSISDTVYAPVVRDTTTDISDNLKISGVKDFSFDLDQGFDQGLRVYITGDVQGVGIEGALSDKATSGSTVQLSEVEKMYLRAFTKNFEAGLGNLSVKLPYDIQDEIQGARIGIHTADKNNAWNCAYAVNRGVTKRTRFAGEEGKQSPYFLEKPVISGSERVYLGQGIDPPMLLNIDEDYKIDYENGILSFTNKNIITGNSRIEIEYKQAVADYPNIYAETDAEIDLRYASFTGLFRRRYDDKENPLTFSLAPEEKDSLESAGDTSNVVHTYADSSETGDYIIDAGHFVYVGVDSGIYTVNFFYVGENNGAYVYDPDLNAFVYQGPDQGNYSPDKLVPLPEKHDFYGAGMYLLKTLQVNVFGAVIDKNTFSHIDDADNMGMGCEAYLKKDLGMFSLEGEYLFYDNQFGKPMEQEKLDYQYQWNTTDRLEELADINASIEPLSFLQLGAGYGVLNRTHERRSLTIAPWFFKFGYEVVDTIDKYYASAARGIGKFHVRSQYAYIENTHLLDYSVQYDIQKHGHVNISGNYNKDSLNRGITTVFDIATRPLSFSIGHRLYNDTVFLFGNAALHIEYKFGAIIGNIEQTQRYSQKRDETYIKVDEGAGNYVYDSLTNTYVEKQGGDYVRKIYLLQDFERVINRNYSFEASFQQSIVDLTGRFHYTEESNFKSNLGELILCFNKEPYAMEMNIQQDLVNDGRYALYEIRNRERSLVVAPSYKTLASRFEIKQMIEQYNAFISETRDSYKTRISWRILSNPLAKPEIGYAYHKLSSGYFANTDILLYEPRAGLLIGIPIKTMGRVELNGALIQRTYNIDDVPYFFAAAEPPGLTKTLTLTASFGVSKYTMLSLIYHIDISPENDLRQNLRFQTKIRF